MNKNNVKALAFRILCVVCCTAAVICISNISVGSIFNLKELLAVCAGGFLLSLPVFAGARKNTERNAGLPDVLPRNMLIAGTITGIMFILAAVSRPELPVQNGNGTIRNAESVSDMVALLFFNSRPILYGCLLYLLLNIVFRNTDTGTSAGTVQNDCDENSSPAETDSRIERLSCREKEVARLAAARLTNMQIAEELYISIPTVKRHLATIFEKTGITSRRELTAIFYPDNVPNLPEIRRVENLDVFKRKE